MIFVEPETWPDGVYFALGAMFGLLLGASVASVIDLQLIFALLITGGSAVLFGLLGVAIREDLIGVLHHWF
jgi:hypothetical protein